MLKRTKLVPQSFWIFLFCVDVGLSFGVLEPLVYYNQRITDLTGLIFERRSYFGPGTLLYSCPKVYSQREPPGKMSHLSLDWTESQDVGVTIG